MNNESKNEKFYNVSSNLEAPHSKVNLTKIQLVTEIEKIIREKNLTQTKIAEILGINQPKVSRLMKYKLNDFSIERLLHFLNVLGKNINISMLMKPRNQECGLTNINLESSQESIIKESTIQENTHYIYTDNNLFRKLVKSNNEFYWNSFYDAITKTIPSMKEGFYKQIFTSFSFLEAIGEGRIRTKYSHKLNLNKFSLTKTNLSSDEVSDQDEEILNRKVLNEASFNAMHHFKKHPELSKANLLKKIEIQLAYSKNLPTEELIKNTLIRYKESIIHNYETCLDKFAADLAWDSICSFDFLQLNQRINDNNPDFRRQFIKLKKMLLHVFHDAQSKGRDLNSFRLCEAIQKERLTSKEFIQQIELKNGGGKYKISIPGMLKDELDLCDVDVIHYATLGYMDPEFNRTFPVIVFTCDDRNIVKNRILIQLSILRNICNDSNQLKLVPGEIHFIDSQTGKINADPLIIADIGETETFETKVVKLPLDAEKSYVEFIKTVPITVASSQNQHFINVIEPQSFEELQELLNMRKDTYLFRGQSPHYRELDSTLARELRGLTSKLPRVYIPELPLSRWPFKEMHRYHWIILKTFIPDEDVLKPLNGQGDPLFEIIRYIQMNPSQEKIRNAIPSHPTPTLEFSLSSDTALYFSTYKENEDGGIYCLKKDSISTVTSFNEALDTMIKNEDPFPCILEPLAKLNDLEDLKPKRQQAAYVFQRDLRYPINRYASIEKIIIKKSIYPFAKIYLESKGITKDFIYGKD